MIDIRHRLPASKLLARDRRRPIVYLRSFRDDAEKGDALGKIDPGLQALGSGGVPGILAAEALEADLAEAVSDLGPFVAIGCPGEHLPPLGASRMYVGDDPLFRAHDAEVIGLLIDANADVNARDHSRRTPLFSFLRAVDAGVQEARRTEPASVFPKL